MAPKMPRRMAWRPTTTTAATRTLKLDMMNRICAAAARAFFSSRWPMYWLATTAPPVASAVMIWIIRVLKVSTRLTPDTAASPTDDTMRVSARPMVTLRACSAISGSSSAVSCWRVNKGFDSNFVLVIRSSALPPEGAFLKSRQTYSYDTASSPKRQGDVYKNLSKF